MTLFVQVVGKVVAFAWLNEQPPNRVLLGTTPGPSPIEKRLAARAARSVSVEPTLNVRLADTGVGFEGVPALEGVILLVDLNVFAA